MKLKRDDVLTFFVGIDKILKAEGEQEYKFNYGLIKNKKILKAEAEEIMDMVTTLDKSRQNLIIKYCAKDKDGKPVIVNGQYTGLEKGLNLDADKAFDELNADRKRYLDEEIEVKEYKISKDVCPKKMKGVFQEIVMEFLDE